MDYNTKAIGCVIRKLRIRRSLTQTVLADLSGVARSHLSDIENGLKSPNIATLWRIANALEIRASELVRMTEERL